MRERRNEYKQVYRLVPINLPIPLGAIPLHGRQIHPPLLNPTPPTSFLAVVRQVSRVTVSVRFLPLPQIAVVSPDRRIVLSLLLALLILKNVGIPDLAILSPLHVLTVLSVTVLPPVTISLTSPPHRFTSRATWPRVRV